MCKRSFICLAYNINEQRLLQNWESITWTVFSVFSFTFKDSLMIYFLKVRCYKLLIVLVLLQVGCVHSLGMIDVSVMKLWIWLMSVTADSAAACIAILATSDDQLSCHCTLHMLLMRLLGSASSNRLTALSFRLTTLSRWAFAVSVANVWNDLPADDTSAMSLSVFMQHCKIFLFHSSFDIWNTYQSGLFRPLMLLLLLLLQQLVMMMLMIWQWDADECRCSPGGCCNARCQRN